jgi:hypothetical protein
MIRITDEMVRPRGGIVHVEWVGQFDGRDYPAEGFEDYAMTYAYRPTGDHSFEIVQKSDGRVVGMGRMELSADGRSLTTVSVNNGTTTVFEKR